MAWCSFKAPGHLYILPFLTRTQDPVTGLCVRFMNPVHILTRCI